MVSFAGILTFGVMILGGFLAFNVVRAEIKPGNFSPLIQNLITKFNLNPTEVQTVMNDTRTQQLSSRLDRAVTNKEITADQKVLIINKISDMEKQVSDINGKQLTVAERQTQMQQLRSDLNTWATSNNIPPRLLMVGLGGKGEGSGERGFGGGMGGGMGNGMMGGR